MSKASVATEKLVERAAQAALKGKIATTDTEQKFSMKGVPEPVYWGVIVEPIKPKTMTSSGILHLAQETQDIEKFHINLGKVMKIGPLAFQGKTESGIDLSVEASRIKVGIFIMWYRHTGQEIKTRSKSNGEIRVFRQISCDDFMCIPEDKDEVIFWAG